MEIAMRPDSTALGELHARATATASELAQLPGNDVEDVCGALRERLCRGSDDGGLAYRLRPMLNRVLDVLDCSWLTESEKLEIEGWFFDQLRYDRLRLAA